MKPDHRSLFETFHDTLADVATPDDLAGATVAASGRLGLPTVMAGATYVRARRDRRPLLLR